MNTTYLLHHLPMASAERAPKAPAVSFGEDTEDDARGAAAPARRIIDTDMAAILYTFGSTGGELLVGGMPLTRRDSRIPSVGGGPSRWPGGAEMGVNGCSIGPC